MTAIGEDGGLGLSVVTAVAVDQHIGTVTATTLNLNMAAQAVKGKTPRVKNVSSNHVD